MRRALALILFVASCESLAAPTIFAGPVTPVSGVCDPASQGVLTQHGAAIVFAANSGTLVLHGTRTGNDLSASLTLPGADRKPFALVFNGVVNGAAIGGTYTTPRCRYSVALKRTGD